MNVPPTIEQIEDELRASRTQAWDVETFLAHRHQARIDALTEPGKPTWARRWSVAKEAFWGVMAIIGYLATLTIGTMWIIGGEFPIHAHTKAERYAIELVDRGLLLPAPAPPSD